MQKNLLLVSLLFFYSIINYGQGRMLPKAGYWQQQVNYTIQAELNDSLNTVQGTESLIYTNNSPDTLTECYFHLYQNAFQPNSYLHDIYKANNEQVIFGKYEKEGKGLEVHSVSIQNKPVDFVIDNTIMRVKLPKALLPGQSINFNIDFTTYFDKGSMRRRFKIFTHNGVKHFDGVHWYPRIAVYDAKFKWNKDQHLGREFYGNYGSFDVKLTFPSKYVMEATGVLQNESEVLPSDYKQQIQISNFKTPKKKGEGITEFTFTNPKKTWHFKAENVHDFAWTADPSYRIMEDVWNGIKIVSIVQEQNAYGWQKTTDFTKKVIQIYSRDFGMYEWPKIVVADAQDGMEYPMLTLCGGIDPSNHFVIAHEVGHEWFFGMIGNNETYRAMLDEGFTQFATIWAIDRIDGSIQKKGGKKITKMFSNPISNKEASLYRSYLRTAIQRDNTTLNTHSDDFNGAVGHGGGYGLVYYKTATMLENLRYVLGDSLFLKAIKNYVSDWKFRHPYPDDFRQSVINTTKTDLNWFFDQWLETYKVSDYSINSVKKGKKENEYQITFERKERMQNPIDFTVLGSSGTKYNYHIPNTDFIKPTSATILPKWLGWDVIRPTYTASVTIPEKIKNVFIDTSLTLADIDMVDNQWKNRIQWQFDSRVATNPNRYKYMIYYRPDIWFNNIDGVKLGWHLNGNYYEMKEQFSVTAWYNSGIGSNPYYKDLLIKNPNNLIDWSAYYRSPMFLTKQNFSYYISGKMLDGLRSFNLGIQKQLSPSWKMDVFAKGLNRNLQSSSLYLYFPNDWEINKWNNTLNAKFYSSISNNSLIGNFEFLVRSSSFLSDYNYSSVSLQSTESYRLKHIHIKTRATASYLFGNSIAPESKLFLAGANPEQMMDDKFYRSVTVTDRFATGLSKTYQPYHMGGGLNVRGYNGYYAPLNLKNGDQINLYSNNGGISFQTELDFNSILGKKIKVFRDFLSLNPYIFSDWASVVYEGNGKQANFSPVYMSSGIGFALTKRWGPFTKESPLTIRADFPLFLNTTPFESRDNFQFRWLVGIGRAF